MASKHRNMLHKNKKQETKENDETFQDLVSGHCSSCQNIIPLSKLIVCQKSKLIYLCPVCYKKDDHQETYLVYFIKLHVIDCFNISQDIIITEDNAQKIIGIPVSDFLVSSPAVISECWKKVELRLLGSEIERSTKRMCRFIVSVVPFGSKIVSILSGEISVLSTNVQNQLES